MQPDLTAGKLVSGLCFGVVTYFATGFLLAVMPEMQQSPYTAPAGAFVGFVIGWRVMGDLLGVDLRGAARRGIGTSIWISVWGVVLLSTAEMLKRATEHRVGKVSDAVGRVFEIMVEIGVHMIDMQVVGTLVLGGMAAGIISELANRRWN
jgi:hypothetical protein